MSKLNNIVNNKNIIKKIETFLIVLFVVLVAWDLYLAVNEPANNTISKVIQDNVDSGKYILTYFWGTACANVFFPLNKKPKIDPTIGTFIMYVIALLIWFINPQKTVESLFQSDLYRYGLGMAFGFLVGILF